MQFTTAALKEGVVPMNYSTDIDANQLFFNPKQLCLLLMHAFSACILLIETVSHCLSMVRSQCSELGNDSSVLTGGSGALLTAGLRRAQWFIIKGSEMDQVGYLQNTSCTQI